jgi:NADH:ubiquinone reductase (non-electrogenic)
LWLDFLKEDVHKWFPELENSVQITLVEAGKTLLSSFDAKLSEYTMKTFQTRKIDVRTGVAVKEGAILIDRTFLIISISISSEET